MPEDNSPESDALSTSDPQPKSLLGSDELEAEDSTQVIAPRRRPLIYSHLRGVSVPTGHITVPQALDEIGKHDSDTWGTQKSFRYMPIVRLRDRDRRRVQLALMYKPLGAANNRIIERDLPEGFDGPNAGELRRQFQKARKKLKVALETSQIKARYHKTAHELAELPTALCSSRARATMMLGITKNDRQRYCAIFIEISSFNAWLVNQSEPKLERDTALGPYGPITRGRIADAISQTAADVNFYPKSNDLLELINDAIASKEGPEISAADIKRLRQKLSQPFKDRGTRQSQDPKNLKLHRDAFISAIQTALPTKFTPP